MNRALLVKLTSLGDLIHALPALTDAQKAIPGLSFDWVVDENFQEVALWHPAVQKIFPTNHRKWRAHPFEQKTREQIGELIRQLRSSRYDLVIDGQGNFKSALISLFAKGMRAGFDRHSAREWIAHLAYQKKYPASWKLHAIERLRRLFASALGYPFPLSPPDFQIQRNRFIKPSFELAPEYLLFIHSAAWKTKLWPESHWQELIERAAASGLTIYLPWGSRTEEARALRLAAASKAQVLPRMRLSEIGYVIERAKGCVSMDTGLSHLAAALDIPSVTLYGATDSGLIGASGGSQIHLQSTLACSPCQKKTCRFNTEENPCLAELSPRRVLKELLNLIGHP